MRLSRHLVLLVLLAVGACAKQSPTAEVTWIGQYTVSSTAQADNPGSLSGKISQSSGPQNLQTTTRIPAAVGTHFGYGFVIRDVEAKDLRVRYVWRFPDGGLTNPSTGKTAANFEIERDCRVGDWCSNAWFLNHDWELKPGPWTAEVWLGQSLLLSRTFEVYAP
jgi:hypothetical protein